MEKLFELKQQRAEMVTKMRAMMDKFDGAEMGAEDQAAYARMETEFDTLNARIETEERQQARERLIGEQGGRGEPRVGKQDEMKRAFRDHLRLGTPSTLAAYNALQMEDPTQAGYLVATEEFRNELIKGVDDAVLIRGLARRYTLRGAHSMGFPKRTARMSSAAWGTEVSLPKMDESLAFGKREFKPNYLTAGIRVTRPLIYNAPDVEGIVRDEILGNLNGVMETAYMTGSGANQPLGLFTASADGISTARDISAGNTTTAITFDGLIEAKYAIKAQYWPRLHWIFHRSAIKELAKIKDSDGQYIWQQSVVQGTPDMLLGIPVLMSEYAPNTFTAGKYVGLLGDLSNYWIVDGMALEIMVLTELYAPENQIGYIARLSTDGMPVLEEAFARVTLANA